MSEGDPFAALGLPARAGLTDDDIRAAWRRIAAATHPDRDDGGDPGRFAAAAAAYETLRTSFGRGEAVADMAEPAPALRGPGRRRFPLAGRPRRRVARLVARLLGAAAVVAVAAAAAGWSPGTVGVAVGALTWLAAGIRINDREKRGHSPAIISQGEPSEAP